MSRYVHGHTPSVVASHGDRTAENSAGYLLPYLGPRTRLLDVGCGPGSITLDLAERVGEAVGVDGSAAVIERARSAAGTKGDGRTVFEVADALALPFADDSFDVTHAHQVLQHVGDPVAVLREMARVTRPGGLVAVRDADYEAMTWAPAHPGLTRWLDLYRAAARGAGGEPDAGRHLLRWCHEAGLADVRAGASLWCYADDDARAWWGGQWQQRAVESNFHDEVLAQGLGDEVTIAEVVDGWRAWTDSPDGWFVIVHGEVLARV
ncbi:methyltransferase domain-containing protein [Janibacter cremeus]|uniref:SAM-dependent methyltransferase n=1 Tax=Janibacter cremeus TaxID=1285192 RepID=A0A852VSY3_9MICO|nr:methyltransferase domain-containing protein [Janibacter cremeus]NYF99089.1 SAM-dependent methyltransferase [Janibacter cremeus]